MIELTLNFLEEERKEFLRENNENNINSNKIIERIKEINLDKKDYSIVILLIKQFQKNKDNQKEISSIIDIFLSDIKFIKYSLFFLGKIFENKLKKEKLFEKNKFDEFFIDEKNKNYVEKKINEVLFKQNNNLLFEILLYYFEVYYENYYFYKVEKENEDNYYKKI